MATPLDQVIAANFAGGGAVPEDVEQVKRPEPPVGHFGYTEEDAKKVREENEERGATVDVENTAATDSAAASALSVEESGRGGEVSRRHDDTATRDGAIANVAGSGTKAGNKRRVAREEAVQSAPAGQSRSGSQPEE